jgi:branched-chain amino acid transport system substrate-binding protein
VLGLCALALSACGKSSSGGSSSSASSSSSSGSSESSGGGTATTASSEGEGEPLTIGMTIEKTGPLSVLAPAAEGAEAAVEYLNKNGGVNGSPVKLIVQDNASQSSRAIQTIGQLKQQGADIIIGGAFIQDCYAIEATVAKEEIPNICLSPSDLKTEAPPFQYGIGPATSEEDQTLYAYMKEQGVKTVGTLAATDESGEQAKEWAKEFGEEENGLKVDVQSTDAEATSFKPQLQQMLSAGAEGLYLTSCGGVSITAASEAVSLNFEGPSVLINCFAGESVAGAVKGFANGHLMTLAPGFMLGAPFAPKRKEADELYNKEVGVNEITTADGWDGVLLAAKAAEESGSTEPAALNETLENNFEYYGPWAGGTFTPEDHRGQEDEGTLEPAIYTKAGKLERAK